MKHTKSDKCNLIEFLVLNIRFNFCSIHILCSSIIPWCDVQLSPFFHVWIHYKIFLFFYAKLKVSRKIRFLFLILNPVIIDTFFQEYILLVEFKGINIYFL